MLDEAEELLGWPSDVGVRGQFRDVKESVEANRAAVAVLQKNDGAMLSCRWSRL